MLLHDRHKDLVVELDDVSACGHLQARVGLLQNHAAEHDLVGLGLLPVLADDLLEGNLGRGRGSSKQMVSILGA